MHFYSTNFIKIMIFDYSKLYNSQLPKYILKLRDLNNVIN